MPNLPMRQELAREIHAMWAEMLLADNPVRFNVLDGREFPRINITMTGAGISVTEDDWINIPDDMELLFELLNTRDLIQRNQMPEGWESPLQKNHEATVDLGGGWSMKVSLKKMKLHRGATCVRSFPEAFTTNIFHALVTRELIRRANARKAQQPGE